ncbi:MAG: retropepsin-like aspartic protease family protein, partial [Methyloligellaceae bacterium]
VFLRADRHNQFFADAYVNNRRIRVLVDTGASHVSLRYEDARELGLYLSDRDFTHTARTANGVARVAPVRIDRIRIGEVSVRDVEAFVGEEGASFATLLGMSFLRKLKSVNFSGRQLELVQ